MADSTADPPSRVIVATPRLPPVNVDAAAAVRSMAPVSARPPTMMNSPAKNASVDHSTSRMVVGRVDAGDEEQETGAQQGHHRRLVVQHRVQHEGEDDRAQDHPTRHQQASVGDRLALVQAHHGGRTLGS